MGRSIGGIDAPAGRVELNEPRAFFGAAVPDEHEMIRAAREIRNTCPAIGPFAEDKRIVADAAEQCIAATERHERVIATAAEHRACRSMAADEQVIPRA